jgi:hypothetical protein
LLVNSLSKFSYLSPSPPSIKYVNHEGEHNTEFAVYLANNYDAISIATSLNMEYKGCIGTLPNHHLFSVRGIPTKETIDKLDDHPHIEWYAEQTLRWRYTRTEIQSSPPPEQNNNSTHVDASVDDSSGNTTETPKFIPQDPLFPEQWHLQNLGQHKGFLSEDMNVLGAWQLSRGRGVCVAIVDDGIMVSMAFVMRLRREQITLCARVRVFVPPWY